MILIMSDLQPTALHEILRYCSKIRMVRQTFRPVRFWGKTCALLHGGGWYYFRVYPGLHNGRNRSPLDISCHSRRCTAPASLQWGWFGFRPVTIEKVELLDAAAAYHHDRPMQEALRLRCRAQTKLSLVYIRLKRLLAHIGNWKQSWREPRYIGGSQWFECIASNLLPIIAHRES